METDAITNCPSGMLSVNDRSITVEYCQRVCKSRCNGGFADFIGKKGMQKYKPYKKRKHGRKWGKSPHTFHYQGEETSQPQKNRPVKLSTSEKAILARLDATGEDIEVIRSLDLVKRG